MKAAEQHTRNFYDCVIRTLNAEARLSNAKTRLYRAEIKVQDLHAELQERLRDFSNVSECREDLAKLLKSVNRAEQTLDRAQDYRQDCEITRDQALYNQDRAERKIIELIDTQSDDFDIEPETDLPAAAPTL